MFVEVIVNLAPTDLVGELVLFVRSRVIVRVIDAIDLLDLSDALDHDLAEDFYKILIVVVVELLLIACAKTHCELLNPVGVLDEQMEVIEAGILLA